MTDAILTQTANVTTLRPVTRLIPVTRKTLVPQSLSPLSPLSLLLFFTIHARDKGLETTGVTSDTGDTGDKVSRERQPSGVGHRVVMQGTVTRGVGFRSLCNTGTSNPPHSHAHKIFRWGN